MSVKFEFPSLPFQDIKEKPKRHGRTHARTERRTDGQRENSISPQTLSPQTKFAGDINIQIIKKSEKIVISLTCCFSIEKNCLFKNITAYHFLFLFTDFLKWLLHVLRQI